MTSPLIEPSANSSLTTLANVRLACNERMANVQKAGSKKIIELRFINTLRHFINTPSNDYYFFIQLFYSFPLFYHYVW